VYAALPQIPVAEVQLPKAQQRFVIQMLDTVLQQQAV
jgi:hypothetical protein